MSTRITMDCRPIRVPQAIMSNQDHGTATVLNPFTGKSYLMNEVGALILGWCDGSRTPRDISDALATMFGGCGAAEITSDVMEFLEGCLRAGLVTMSS